MSVLTQGFHIFGVYDWFFMGAKPFKHYSPPLIFANDISINAWLVFDGMN